MQQRAQVIRYIHLHLPVHQKHVLRPQHPAPLVLCMRGPVSRARVLAQHGDVGAQLCEQGEEVNPRRVGLLQLLQRQLPLSVVRAW